MPTIIHPRPGSARKDFRFWIEAAMLCFLMSATAPALAESVGNGPGNCGPNRVWKSEFTGLGWTGSCVPVNPREDTKVDPQEAQRKAQAEADRRNLEYFNNTIQSSVRAQNAAVRTLSQKLYAACTRTDEELIKKFSIFYDLAGRHPTEVGGISWSPYETNRERSIYKWMYDALDANHEMCLQAFFKAMPALVSVRYRGVATEPVQSLPGSALGLWMKSSGTGPYALKTVSRDFGDGTKNENTLRFELVPVRRLVAGQAQKTMPDLAAADPVRKYLLRPQLLQTLYREFDIFEANPGDGHPYYSGISVAALRGLARQLGAFALRDTGYYADLATGLELIQVVGSDTLTRYHAELMKFSTPASATERANRASLDTLLKVSLAQRIIYAGLLSGTDLSSEAGVSRLWRDYAQAGFTAANGGTYESGATWDHSKYGAFVTEEELQGQVGIAQVKLHLLLASQQDKPASEAGQHLPKPDAPPAPTIVTLEQRAEQAAREGTSSAAYFKLVQDLVTLKTYLAMLSEETKRALCERLVPLLITALPGRSDASAVVGRDANAALAQAIGALVKASPLVVKRLGGEELTKTALGEYQPDDATAVEDENEFQAALPAPFKGKMSAREAAAMADLEETVASLQWEDTLSVTDSVLSVVVGGPGSEVPSLTTQAATQLRPLQVQRLLAGENGSPPLRVYEDVLDEAWRVHLRLFNDDPGAYGNPRMSPNVQANGFRFWHNSFRTDEPPLPRDLKQMSETQWAQLDEYTDAMSDLEERLAAQHWARRNPGQQIPVRNRLLMRALAVRQILRSDPVPDGHSLPVRAVQAIGRGIRSIYRSLPRLIQPVDMEMVAMATPQLHVLNEFMLLTEPALLAQASTLATASGSLLAAVPATAAATAVTGAGTASVGLSALFIGIIGFL